MKIDHLFIFSENPEADVSELIQAGLTEGSSRVHPGQGTRNRKFYFENFYLEIVWVYDEKEIKSDLTAPTCLWERANCRSSGFSPFGLMLAHSPDTDALFKDCLIYNPAYLPEDLSFEIITNEKYPDFPMVGRLSAPFQSSNEGEPNLHPLGIRQLTGMRFGIPEADFENDFTGFFKNKEQIGFEESETHYVTLEFDHRRKNRRITFKGLPLSIVY